MVSDTWTWEHSGRESDILSYRLSDTPASAVKGEAVSCLTCQDTWGECTTCGGSYKNHPIWLALYAQPQPSQQADPVPPEWTGQGTDADFFVPAQTEFSRASQQAVKEGALSPPVVHGWPDRAQITSLIVDMTGAGTLGLTNGASIQAAKPIADAILALFHPGDTPEGEAK